MSNVDEINERIKAAQVKQLRAEEIAAELGNDELISLLADIHSESVSVLKELGLYDGGK